jgi:hypothetical protein
MRTIWLTALAFGLATPAMAAATVPEEYQGVWAAARDCKGNFQNILSNVVNREFAACRVMQVLSSGHPESHTSYHLSELRGSAEPRNLAWRKYRGHGLSCHNSI